VTSSSVATSLLPEVPILLSCRVCCVESDLGSTTSQDHLLLLGSKVLPNDAARGSAIRGLRHVAEPENLDRLTSRYYCVELALAACVLCSSTAYCIWIVCRLGLAMTRMLLSPQDQWSCSGTVLLIPPPATLEFLCTLRGLLTY
jgi:hypothetical protein